MTKKQKDKAFIDKLKTLQISTGGGKGSPEPVCDACGGTFDEHVVNGLKSMVSQIEIDIQRRKESIAQEDSFAA